MTQNVRAIKEQAKARREAFAKQAKAKDFSPRKEAQFAIHKSVESLNRTSKEKADATLSLSLQNDKLIATDSEGHSISISQDLNGLRLLKQLLLAKTIMPKRLASGTKPLQEQVEAFLKTKKLEAAIKSQEELNALKEIF